MLRDAADSNQRVSRFCKPLPTAVIPIRAEGASLVEGSCVPFGSKRPEVERDIPFIFALDFVFLHKRNRPFCVTLSCFTCFMPSHNATAKVQIICEMTSRLRVKSAKRRPYIWNFRIFLKNIFFFVCLRCISFHKHHEIDRHIRHFVILIDLAFVGNDSSRKDIVLRNL